MRKLAVIEWMSLDGVVQAPAYADEDTSGGSNHGGWHLTYFEDASRQWVVNSIAEAAGFVLGRRTYEGFASHWPNASEEEQPLAQPLNDKPKFVASRTLDGPLSWQNSHLLGSDVPVAVSDLKREAGGDLLAIGSSELVTSLIGSGLVDEVRLMIDPIVLGGGKRIFHDDGTKRPMRLLSSEPTATGAVLATYGLE